MSKIYHDPQNPAPDAVERYAVLNMRGGTDREEPDRLYDINILRSQVLADVEGELSVVTIARRDKKTGLQDNNIERTEAIQPLLSRWFDKYMAGAKGAMAGALCERDSRNAANMVQDEDCRTITIRMGSWWNKAMFKPLANAVHDYVANGLMYEYLLLYFTTNDPLTQEKKQQTEDAYAAIRRCLTAYIAGKVRKGMHPFP